jgi:phosphotransferase system enzyme I (PtsI)
VLSLVQRITAAARAAGREASVCGEMAGDVRGARIAIGLGADALSVAPARAAFVRRALAQTTRDACVAEAQSACR